MPSKEDFEAFFKKADTDGNGMLALDELVVMLKSQNYGGGDSQIRSFFLSCDMNSDGKVTFNEYMEAMGQAPPQVHKGAAYRRVFKEFDTDGSGEIEKGELKKVMAEMNKHFSDEEIARMIELFDKDGSGTLNYEEFVKRIFGKDV